MPDQPSSSPLIEDRLRDQRLADLVFAGSVVGALVIVAVLYVFFPGIVMMLLLGAIFAYALLPVVDRLDRYMPRLLAVVLVAVLLVGILSTVVVLFAPAVAREIVQLPTVFNQTVEIVVSLWNGLRQRLPDPLGRMIEGTMRTPTAALRRIAPDVETLTSWATAAAAGVGAVASAVVFVPIFVFLMLRRFHSFLARLGRIVPPRWQERFQWRIHESDVVLSGFIRGQLLVAALLAITYGVAFSLLGIPLGLVIGLMAGLGELVPFLGGIIAVVFGSLMALAGGHPLDVLWVIGIYFVVQAIQGAVVSPWIMGQKVQLGPVAVIVALAIGGQLFGFVGLLLAVPAAALLKVATRAAFDAYRESPFFRRRAPA